MFLPAAMIPILAEFVPAFTQPTYQKAVVLVVGTILVKGRRTALYVNENETDLP